jgi:hypothetical protein
MITPIMTPMAIPAFAPLLRPESFSEQEKEPLKAFWSFLSLSRLEQRKDPVLWICVSP